MSRIATILLGIALLIMTLGDTAYAHARRLRSNAVLYELPDKGSLVLDVIPRGMKVELVIEKGAWAQVRLTVSAELGWIETGLLTGPVPEKETGPQVIESAAGVSMSEVEKLEGRLYSMGYNLGEVEAGVDGLIRKLEHRESNGSVGRKGTRDDRTPAAGAWIGPGAAEPGRYRWCNGFSMGRYFSGGEDFFGLAVSRLVDSRGSSRIDLEIGYGLARESSETGDFLEWSLGFRFNLLPQEYRIYPFLGAHFGMRHIFDPPAGDPSQALLCMPGLGVNAELNGIFSLSAEVRSLFLFRQGERTDEGRISLGCVYLY
ncbi:MAG: hypothetical protein U9N45_03950 [Gemmatimonadota bacterium]|nr:hypothetical protein [Gemmatimonadota bacterium]